MEQVHLQNPNYVNDNLAKICNNDFWKGAEKGSA